MNIDMHSGSQLIASQLHRIDDGFFFQKILNTHQYTVDRAKQLDVYDVNKCRMTIFFCP